MQAFEIHVSRRALLFFILCALIMLWFGLEIVWLHNIFGPEDFVAQPILVYLAAGFFFGVIPLLIAWKQVKHLINPPLMLRVDAENVTFGTGFGYRPLSIPTKHLKTASVGVSTPDASTLRPGNIIGLGGLVLTFDKGADITKGAITSAGIKYSFGRLVISRLYANRGLKESVEAIKPFIKK